MNKIRLGVLAFGAAAAFSAAPADVSAAQKIVPGMMCDNYNAGEANDIDRFVFGIRTTAAAARNVVCGLPRELTVNGATVVVNGNTFGTAGVTMPITVYSSSPSGTIRSFHSVTGSGAAAFQISVPFSSTEALANDQLAALVTLPASSGGYYYMTSLDH